MVEHGHACRVRHGLPHRQTAAHCRGQSSGTRQVTSAATTMTTTRASFLTASPAGLAPYRPFITWMRGSADAATAAGVSGPTEGTSDQALINRSATTSTTGTSTRNPSPVPPPVTRSWPGFTRPNRHQEACRQQCQVKKIRSDAKVFHVHSDHSALFRKAQLLRGDPAPSPT
jgi:hypothetical protein